MSIDKTLISGFGAPFRLATPSPGSGGGESLRAATVRQWEANVAGTGRHVGAEPPEWIKLAADGFHYPPFKWGEERRAFLRAELDALYGHLYGLTWEEMDYIMDTFPIVKRKDEQAHGEYRTKRVILEMYDQMAALPKIEVPHPKGLDEEYLVPDVSGFETWLSPPPADPGVAHPEREKGF